MKRFAQVSLTVLSLLAFTLPASAESISEAVQATVTSHPKIDAASQGRMAVDEELNQANGLYLPQVDLRGDLGLGWSKRWGPDSEDDDDILPNAAAQLTLQQMLFDGFNASSEVARQENRVRSSAYRVSETAEFTALDAVEAYLNVLRARQLLELAETNVRDHLDRQSDISRRQRGGAGNMADVNQAAARLSQAEATRAQIEGDLRSAESRYNSVVGHFPADVMRPQVPLTYMPADEQAAVDAALQDSPTIRALASDISVAESERKQTDSVFYPQVNLEGAASRQKDLAGLRTTKDEITGGLVMRWNLYRGGADMAKSEEYVHRQAQAESELKAARRDAEDSMRNAWAARDAARKRAEHYATQVNSNEDVLAAYLKQFTAGDRTLLDVLDAQNELFLSKVNMVTAYYTALFGDYQVLAERGALLPSLQVAPPAAATVAEKNQ